jgi:hypothetical protein
MGDGADGDAVVKMTATVDQAGTTARKHGGGRSSNHKGGGTGTSNRGSEVGHAMATAGTDLATPRAIHAAAVASAAPGGRH